MAKRAVMVCSRRVRGCGHIDYEESFGSPLVCPNCGKTDIREVSLSSIENVTESVNRPKALELLGIGVEQRSK